MARASNLSDFRRSLRKATDGLAENQVKAVRDKIAFQALRGVVLRTPVDTGAARASWQVSFGQAPALSASAGAVDKGGGIAIAQGAQQIGVAPPFTVLFVASGLIYMPKLENGSSRQAPNGMVSVTAADLRAQFRGIIR